MWLQKDGNVLATVLVVKEPVFEEERGVYKSPCTQVRAKSRISAAEGSTDIPVDLQFYGDYAIPARGSVTVGDRLLVAGRSRTNEFYRRTTGKNELSRSMIVEFWWPIANDPYNFLQIMQTQSELLCQKWLSKTDEIVSQIPVLEDKRNE